MCNTLRKVRYRLCAVDGFMPDLTQKELDVKNEMEKERTGFFLKFTKEVEKSPQTGEPIEVTKAIVKGETGEIHIIDPALMEFMDKTE